MRLGLECLEDRVTPTIVFSPQFGAETVHRGSGYELSSVPVYLIFWGSGWTNWAASSIETETQQILSGTYLSGLTQYGSNGVAWYANAVFNSSNPNANGFTLDDINGVVRNAISNQGLPGPNGSAGPLYVVLTSGVSFADDLSLGGFNIHDPVSNATFAWVGSSDTVLLSHEIVEAMSDPVHPNGVTVTGGETSSPHENQIADGEAGLYSHQVNGVQVQAYWSGRDGGFIIPDGNQQNFYVSGSTLTINGDQLGVPYNDSISIQCGLSSVLVTLNGESIAFDHGFFSIVVNTGSGTDTVAVQHDSGDNTPVTVRKAISFAVAPDGKVWYLYNDGSLAYRTSPTSDTNIAQENVASFAMAPDGQTLYILYTDGVLRRENPVPGGGSVYVINPNVHSFAMAPDGQTLYILYNDGELEKRIPGVSAYTVNPGVRSFTMAPDGQTLYILYADGELEKRIPGVSAYTVNPNVQSFTMAPDGQTLYILYNSGELEKRIPGVSTYTVNPNVRSFTMAPDGQTLYILYRSGELEKRVLGSSVYTVNFNVQSFTMAPDGQTLYILYNSGELEKRIVGVSAYPINPNVQSFTMAPDGWTLYILYNGGELEKRIPGLSADTVNFNVQSFNMAADGRLYILYSNGILEQRILGDSPYTINPNVRSFAMAPDGRTLYILYNDGELEKRIPGVSVYPVNPNVQSFTLAPDGRTLYILYNNGELENRIPGVGAYTINSNVRSFAMAPDGQPLYILRNDGSLWRYDGTFSPLDVGVSTIALGQSPQGSGVVLFVHYPLGTAWYDGSWHGDRATLSGQITSARTGLVGWTMQLLDPSTSAVLTSTTTDSSGNYTVHGLPAGTYRVRVQLPTGWAQLSAYPADLTLTPTQNATSVNFIVQAWTGSGVPLPRNLTAVANLFSHSDEHYIQFITAAYEKYLGREPEPAGLNGWLQNMKNGLSDEQLEAGFIGSPEYIANHGGQGAGWVIGMYHDLLGRTPSQAEVAGWVQALNNGEPPTQVAYGFAASPEREGIRVRGDYLSYLGRSPSQAEVDGWVTAFGYGTSNESVVAGFVGSLENFAQHGNHPDIWLEGAYLCILGRLPSQAEVQGWLNVLQ
jgi:hypothetical protein